MDSDCAVAIVGVCAFAVTAAERVADESAYRFALARAGIDDGVFAGFYNGGEATEDEWGNIRLCGKISSHRLGSDARHVLLSPSGKIVTSTRNDPRHHTVVCVRAGSLRCIARRMTFGISAVEMTRGELLTLFCRLVDIAHVAGAVVIAPIETNALIIQTHTRLLTLRFATNDLSHENQLGDLLLIVGHYSIPIARPNCSAAAVVSRGEQSICCSVSTMLPSASMKVLQEKTEL